VSQGTASWQSGEEVSRRESSKPLLEPKDLEVMDRLLYRAHELSQRVQKQTDEFALKRGKEIQKVLSGSAWEDEKPKKKKKKAAKKK